MQITAIRKQKRRPGRVNVYLDGRFAFSLSEEAAHEAALASGMVLTQEAISALTARDLPWRARDAALTLLSYRSRSRSELRQRLFRKGFPTEIVDPCLDRLEANGLLDDESFARAFVDERLRNRPRGPYALRTELIRRGIDSDLAERVVQEALAGNSESELELARRAFQKFRRSRGEDPIRTRRRLAAYLARRGFSASVVAEFLSEIKLNEGNEDGIEAVDAD